MKCPLLMEQLNSYLDGALPAPEAQEVEKHLVTCSVCSERYESLFATVSALKGLSRPAAPADTADQMLRLIEPGADELMDRRIERMEEPVEEAPAPIPLMTRLIPWTRGLSAACILLVAGFFAFHSVLDRPTISNTGSKEFSNSQSPSSDFSHKAGLNEEAEKDFGADKNVADFEKNIKATKAAEKAEGKEALRDALVENERMKNVPQTQAPQPPAQAVRGGTRNKGSQNQSIKEDSKHGTVSRGMARSTSRSPWGKGKLEKPLGLESENKIVVFVEEEAEVGMILKNIDTQLDQLQKYFDQSDAKLGKQFLAYNVKNDGKAILQKFYQLGAKKKDSNNRRGPSKNTKDSGRAKGAYGAAGGDKGSGAHGAIEEEVGRLCRQAVMEQSAQIMKKGLRDDAAVKVAQSKVADGPPAREDIDGFIKNAKRKRINDKRGNNEEITKAVEKQDPHESQAFSKPEAANQAFKGKGDFPLVRYLKQIDMNKDVVSKMKSSKRRREAAKAGRPQDDDEDETKEKIIDKSGRKNSGSQIDRQQRQDNKPNAATRLSKRYLKDLGIVVIYLGDKPILRIEINKSKAPEKSTK